MRYQPQAVRPTAGQQYTGPSPVERLRAEVCSNGELSFLMEAHDGLSARIAERSGFKRLWASGLSIASSLGFRDANEASWSQLVESVERIVDTTELPVLVDGDGASAISTMPASLHASLARLAPRASRFRTAASRR